MDFATATFGEPGGEMPTYVIHIGPPKAGSKNLQSSLHSIRSQLAAQGIYYPTEWGSIHHAGFLAELQTIPNLRLEAVFQALNRSGHKTVVLSCEGLYRLAPEQLVYLRQLLDGAPVRIVYYWRRWSEWLPSQWQEVVKSGQFETFPQMYVRFTRTPMNSPLINPALTWNKFANVFDRHSLVLISFDNLVDRRLDPFRHFMETVLQCRMPAEPENVLLNTSISKFDIEILRAMNYIHYRTVGKISEETRNLFLRHHDAIDLRALITYLESDVASIPLDDRAAVFAPVMDAMMLFRDQFLNPAQQGDFFTRKVRRFDYVQQNYLLDGSAVRALRDIYALVRATLRKDMVA